MKRKYLIIGGVLVVIIVLLAGFYFGSRGGGTQTIPTPFPTLAPPAPTGIYPQPTSATFSFATAPTTPASAPVYTYQPAQLAAIEALAASAAPRLDLSSTPSALLRDNFSTKVWTRGNDASLRVSQTDNDIAVLYHQGKSTVPAGTYAPNVALQQFLLLLIPSVQGLSIKANGTMAGPFDGLLIRDTPPPASVTGYLYSYTIGGVPILTPDLSIAPISVVVDSGGVIRSASIAPPPASISRGDTIALISKDQVLASLAAGRGVFLDVHSPQVPEQGVIPTFSKFVISDIKLVYAPNNGALLPAYYIAGSGTTPQGSKQDATIFLWAYAEGSL